MPRMDPGNAITPAWNYMTQVLFRPFMLRLWLGLGFASLLTGSGGGSFNFGVPSGGGRGPSSSPIPGTTPAEIGLWVASHMWLTVLVVVAFFAVGIVFTWLSAIFKFVYLEQVVKVSGAVKEPFARLKRLGASYFLWLLAFGGVMLVLLGVLIGLPLLGVFVWTKNASFAAEVLVVAWSAIVFIALTIVASVIDIFARDFVIPAMYIRGIRVLEGWRVIIPILKANAGPSFVYLLLLIVIGFASAVAASFGALVVVLLFLLPIGILVGIGFGVWSIVGHTWSPGLIAYIATAGIALSAALAYAISTVLQPVAVFRRSFALVVLGQADPSLATIPVRPFPPPPPPAPGYGQVEPGPRPPGPERTY